jgi:hypothetical protein
MSIAQLKCTGCGFIWCEEIDHLHIIYCPACTTRYETNSTALD